MKKSISIVLTVMIVALASCRKDTTLIFTTDELSVDLGSTDSDVLQFVKASDGSEVTVSGIDYGKVGLQQAVFKAGPASETRPVKVRADRLAGRYQWCISVLDIDGTYFQLSEPGMDWYWNFSKGNAFNQILIPDSAYSPYSKKMEHIFGNEGALTLTMDKDSLSITPWRGKLYFDVSTLPTDHTFDSIRYGRLPNGDYGILSFRMIENDGKYTNYFRFDFEKAAE